MHTQAILKKGALTALLGALLFSLAAGAALAQGLEVNTETDVRVETQERNGTRFEGNAAAREEARVELERRQEAREEERRERAETRTEVRAEHRANLEASVEARILAYIERTYNRFTAAVTRLGMIGQRLESRIEKFKERGVDTSESEALLAEARVHIGIAHDNVESFAAEARALVESENPRQHFRAVKAILDEAKAEIFEARRALIAAVASLKASAGLDAEAGASVDADSQ